MISKEVVASAAAFVLIALFLAAAALLHGCATFAPITATEADVTTYVETNRCCTIIVLADGKPVAEVRAKRCSPADED